MSVTKHPYEQDWQIPLGVRAIGGSGATTMNQASSRSSIDKVRGTLSGL